MKFTVAIALVIVSMVSAEIPRRRVEIARQSNPPSYVARGWRPEGQQFNLPSKYQQPPIPAASYGPPPEPAEPTTTEMPTTTETSTEEATTTQQQPPQKGNLELEQENKAKEEEAKGPYFVVLPQQQNLVYAVVPQRASLVAAGPNGRLQAVPVNSAVASSIYTPFSASFVQIYQ